MNLGPIGLPELVVLFAVVFCLFGAKNIPKFGRGLGESWREIRKLGEDKENDET